MMIATLLAAAVTRWIDGYSARLTAHNPAAELLDPPHLRGWRIKVMLASRVAADPDVGIPRPVKIVDRGSFPAAIPTPLLGVRMTSHLDNHGTHTPRGMLGRVEVATWR